MPRLKRRLRTPIDDQYFGIPIGQVGEHGYRFEAGLECRSALLAEHHIVFEIAWYEWLLFQNERYKFVFVHGLQCIVGTDFGPDSAMPGIAHVFPAQRAGAMGRIDDYIGRKMH